jgi:hypothetical protein
MSFDRLNKMLARSLVSKIIENGEAGDNKELANLNFKELEELYLKTLKDVEESPDVRKELVESLKNYQKEHGDLNQLYSAEDIASDPQLQAIIFE